MKNAAVVALFTISALGCTLNDAQAGPEEDTSRETSIELGSAAVWTGTTTSGIEVTVRPDRVPIRVGLTVFRISFEHGIPDDIPVSIDVISPEMPVMGLMRYMAEPSGANTYTSSAEIRMDGAWEIYVNLGDGTDAARFAFDVQPGDPAGNNHMDGHDTTVEDIHSQGTHAIGDLETERHQDHDARE